MAGGKRVSAGPLPSATCGGQGKGCGPQRRGTYGWTRMRREWAKSKILSMGQFFGKRESKHRIN